MLIPNSIFLFLNSSREALHNTQLKFIQVIFTYLTLDLSVACQFNPL